MTINVYCRLKFTKPKQCHPISLGPRGYTLFKKKKSCVLFLVVPKAKQKFSLLLINPKVIPSLLRFLRKDFFFFGFLNEIFSVQFSLYYILLV